MTDGKDEDMDMDMDMDEDGDVDVVAAEAWVKELEPLEAVVREEVWGRTTQTRPTSSCPDRSWGWC
jgi:hypothetical protein